MDYKSNMTSGKPSSHTEGWEILNSEYNKQVQHFTYRVQKICLLLGLQFIMMKECI
jgi:ATP-dependent exoDNAse (exonuclease V) beta subunit